MCWTKTKPKIMRRKGAISYFSAIGRRIQSRKVDARERWRLRQGSSFLMGKERSKACGEGKWAVEEGLRDTSKVGFWIWKMLKLRKLERRRRRRNLGRKQRKSKARDKMGDGVGKKEWERNPKTNTRI
jgi:hypothetical protein